MVLSVQHGGSVRADLNTRRKRSKRRKLIERQGLQCFYCHCELVEPKSNTVVEKLERVWATIDHLLPLGRGGTHELDNLVLSCPTCHKERHGG